LTRLAPVVELLAQPLGDLGMISSVETARS